MIRLIADAVYKSCTRKRVCVKYFLTACDRLVHLMINGILKIFVQINQRPKPASLKLYDWCISRKHRNQKQHSYSNTIPLFFILKIV